MATSCVYQTVTLKTGEKFVLPSGAELISATDTSLIQSDCVDLTNLSAKICGTLYIVIDVDDNTGHPNNEEDTKIENIKVGTTILNYSNQLIVVSGNNAGTLVTVSQLNSYIPLSFQSVFKFTNISRSVFDKHQDVTLTFESLDIFQDEIEMKITVFADTQYYKPKTITEGPCS
jgi:hypothetical protein